MWWRDAGVDVLVEDEARDWLARALPQRSVAEEAPVATETPLPETLEAFLAYRLGDEVPDAKWGARIAPTGQAGAELMILLDQPEAEDATNGNLLSGAEGRLLDRMLAAIGQARDSVFLATVAVARPVSGTIPSEIEARLGELSRHLVALVKPRKLLLLGAAASRAGAGPDYSGARGRLRRVKDADDQMVMIASYHPRFLMERPAAKAEAWKHLQLLIGGNSL